MDLEQTIEIVIIDPDTIVFILLLSVFCVTNLSVLSFGRDGLCQKMHGSCLREYSMLECYSDMSI